MRGATLVERVGRISHKGFEVGFRNESSVKVSLSLEIGA